MEIVWLGHSSVKLLSNDVTLITDPYADTVGYSMGHPEAQITTVSNDHPHHSNFASIKGDPRVLKGPGEYEIANFYITGMATPRLTDGHGQDRQINTVFTIRTEGLTLCHLGDLSEPLSPAQVQALNRSHVLFVPAGGICTIGVAKVAELVNLIAPSIVVPLHYRVEGDGLELEPLNGFLAEMGLSQIDPQPRLNVTSANLPRKLRVVVLRRAV